ncbi:MAG: phosphoribosylformylglycinamidine synthase subunit PurL, partial [Nitrososphaerota archaeon]|nr:phosphoribosylformylglycinamidine synthase subunit PurL [Nitrososphaerota archaeon]
MIRLISGELRLGLTSAEVQAVRNALGRKPNETEWAVIDAEWSEHSSYKSSKRLLRLLPTTGRRVLLGPGYDAGVVDIGKGYVVTLHIESHNHPSAIDPYGGAATGIGGVLRDILSMGSRPIALLDMLRFGDVAASSHSRWLFKNVVRGIADYGNCVGVPTVAGDVEFDGSFERNCLVDVGCVGVAKKERLVLGEAKRPGDVLLLIGGSTGRDGVGGATFASKNLTAGSETERSSVQVPAPFTKKLLIDAILEAAETGLIRGMKDLGGGGLSTALSELASKGGTGVDVELTKVMTRQPDMTPAETMISESQERMILVLAPRGSEPVLEVLEKYDVPHAIIGRVTSGGSMKVRVDGRVVVDLPVDLVTGAPLIPRESRRPDVKEGLAPAKRVDPGIGSSLLELVSSPNIASRCWVYRQYDHEVGVRTVVKPGDGDASLLRMPNGTMLAVKADGNSKHSFLDPRSGAAGCVAEACRNVVAVGAEPIAMVDHLQFGDPSDPEVYWAFEES